MPDCVYPAHVGIFLTHKNPVRVLLLLGGGPMLFLAAQGLYLWVVPNIRSQLHLIGWVALLLVGLATLAVQPYVALILVGASLTTLAIFDR